MVGVEASFPGYVVGAIHESPGGAGQIMQKSPANTHKRRIRRRFSRYARAFPHGRFVNRPYYLVTAKTLAVILSEAKDLEESRKRFFVAYAPQNDKFKV